MKRVALLLVVLACGCSTAPLADMLDFFKPGRMNPEPGPFYGGVCQPGAPRGLGTVPPNVLVPTAPPASAPRPTPTPPSPPVVDPGAPPAEPPAP
jgi:hypothetical protein